MKTLCIGVSFSALALLSACAYNNTPELDKKFGQAVRGAVAAQTLNPNGTSTLDPVTSIDASAAASAHERYQDSFKSPPKTFDINTGSR